MTHHEPSTEDREKELTARLQAMEQQLERLTARLSEVPVSTDHEPAGTPQDNNLDYPPEDIGNVSEEVLNWASRTALLPRLATLCFVLVIALILRTVTDSGLINKLIGSGVGMFYAALLVVVSWVRYGKQSPLAPIFAASGALLMSTIVVETHSHFNSLPLVPAYLTLMATGIAMALISRKFNAFTPISVGVISMCFAGAAIDYPHPFFPYLSLLLFTANILGYFAAQLKRCSWLRWSALLVTVAMLQLWGVQIVSALRKGGTVPPELVISWFLPVMAVFALTYISLSLLGIIRSTPENFRIFDLTQPTITVLWAFPMMLYVSKDQAGGSSAILGGVGILLAIGLLGISFWLARRGGRGAPGASSFTFACGVLLALALPAATGKLALSLPLLSLIAIFMAVMSRVWDCGTIRITTYLFHIYSCIALIIAFRGDGPSAMDAVNILPSGLLACIILYQYQWCRWWPPTEGSSFFSRFDSRDRSAVMLLLAGLISAFFTIRISLFQAVGLFPVALQHDAFRCSQSVIINCAAIALILFAYLKQNKEIRNVAVLVLVVGGIKVLLYDLTGTHGLPLVFSVFSFGLAAAAQSVALGKWQKQPLAA
ncbi:MAG: hypothetical protein PHI31_08160 [Desulfuromonadaceae bacterium]|nr:hypothetical protein [Desulfuromonadaceae bacterium]